MLEICNLYTEQRDQCFITGCDFLFLSLGIHMSFKSRRVKLKDKSLNTSVGVLPPDKSIGQPERGNKYIRKNVIEENIYSSR